MLFNSRERKIYKGKINKDRAMTTMEIVFTVLIFILILGGLFSLIKSARKFNLTEQQLKNIMQRNAELDLEDENNRH